MKNDMKHKIKILCVIPSLPSDLKFATIQSILKQTVPVKTLIVLPQKVKGGTTAEKLSRVLNEGLCSIKLEDFDYILRVDADIILPPNFLEENLKSEPDLCGEAGYAMLIRTSTFLRTMNGRFHLRSDDSYTIYRFMKERCHVIKYKVHPITLRQTGLRYRTSYFAKPKHQSIKYYYDRGKSMYELGYEPLHAFGRLRQSFWNLFAVFGYFTCFVRREQKMDVANYVWRKQISRLMGK